MRPAEDRAAELQSLCQDNIMNEIYCAYCGVTVPKPDREDVIPKSLYTLSKSKSKVQRIKVSSCNRCNNSFSDDEAHFRNIMTLAGKPGPITSELWVKVERSLDKKDGKKRLIDIYRQMKPVDNSGSTLYKVYPGKDEKVLRIVRKVVRGLCHYHKLISPVSEAQVWTDILTYPIPFHSLEDMNYHHREKDICEYRYQVINDGGIHSAWLITFLERVTFVALVSSAVPEQNL